MIRAFTVVELMVVITIIAILLALLTPALDKAIYRAELLRCQTNQKGIVSGVQIYATDFKRHYPYRPYARNGVAGSPKRISSSGVVNDTRRLLRPYVSINGHLNCPFTPTKADYDNSTANTIVETSYSLFFGSQFKEEGTGGALLKGMFRLGDRWEWENRMFNVVSVDYDALDQTLAVTYTSHPDGEGAGAPQVRQDEAGVAGTGNVHTFTRWIFTGYKRPPIDTLYALADGSVGLYEQITWDEAELTGKGRMAKTPNYNNGQNYTGGAGQWVHVPKQ